MRRTGEEIIEVFFCLRTEGKMIEMWGHPLYIDIMRTTGNRGVTGFQPVRARVMILYDFWFPKVILGEISLVI